MHLRTDDGLELIALEQSTGGFDTAERRGEQVTVHFSRGDVVALAPSS